MKGISEILPIFLLKPGWRPLRSAPLNQRHQPDIFMGKQLNKEIKRRRRTQLLKRRKEAVRAAIANPGAARKAAAERKAIAPKKKPAAGKKPSAKKVAEVVAAPVAEVAAPVAEVVAAPVAEVAAV